MTDDSVLELARLCREVEARIRSEQRGELFNEESDGSTCNQKSECSICPIRARWRKWEP
jgi:hypothetical protein